MERVRKESWISFWLLKEFGALIVERIQSILLLLRKFWCICCWENSVRFVVVQDILVHLLLREFDPFLSLRKFGAIVVLRELGPFFCWGKFIYFHGIWNNFSGENLLHLLLMKKLVHWLLRELDAFYGNLYILLL